MENDTAVYTIQEAVKKVKDGSKEGFDATVEVHFNLELDKGQSVRFTITLPKGTGKTKKIAVMASKKVAEADLELSEDDLKKIEKGDIKPKVDFDVLIAEPKFMSKIAKVARILGPAGVMPNPKTGTVTTDAEKVVKQVKAGRVEIKTEKDLAMVHTIIGKVSFSDGDLVANFNEIVTSLRQNKPTKAKPDWIKSIFVCSTMGGSFKVRP